MKDQLEDFIRQNKAAFDDKEPSENVWTTIRRQLFNTVSLWSSVTVWRVAAMVLLGLCIYLATPKIADQHENTIALNEFKDVEKF
jgi:hypothetical protein